MTAVIAQEADLIEILPPPALCAKLFVQNNQGLRGLKNQINTLSDLRLKHPKSCLIPLKRRKENLVNIHQICHRHHIHLSGHGCNFQKKRRDAAGTWRVGFGYEVLLKE